MSDSKDPGEEPRLELDPVLPPDHLPKDKPVVASVASVARSKSKRSSLSNSRYAKPNTLIDALAKEVQRYIYFPEPMPMFVVLGVIAANMLKGVPVWLMVVGPSSGGKTLAIEMAGELDRMEMHSSIKGASAFLSGSGKKDTAKNATGGILRQFKVLHEPNCAEQPGCRCPARGMLVIKDFAETLACDHQTLVETVGALRGICDGKWKRSIGGDGGRTINWKGRIGFLGACTPEIDRQHSVIQKLGQRWLYYRFDATDGFGETQKSMQNGDREVMESELCSLVKGFMEMQDLDWDKDERREFTHGEINRFYAMASLVVRARSKTSRDWKTKEVDDIDESEAPMRMSNALGQLFLGLESIGLELKYCWKIIEKIAMDSCPVLPMRVLKVLSDASSVNGGVAGGMVKITDVGRLGGLPVSQQTVARIVEDLSIFGIAVRREGFCGLTEWAKGNLKIGWRIV